MTRVFSLEQGNAARRSGRPFIEQSAVIELLVEQAVQAPVSRFLSDKGARLAAKAVLVVRCQQGQGGAHRVDKKLLPMRKAHRQCIEKSGAERIAATPVTRQRGLEVDQ
jgi:hypothetical protein